MQATQLTEPITEHGEGPVWFEAMGSLCLVDMLAGDIVRLTPSGAVVRWHVGTVAAAIRPRGETGAVLALERSFAVAESFGGSVDMLPEVFADPMVRFNEGGCDPRGRFVAGTMAYAKTPGAGVLYRLDADREPQVLLTNVTVSNGIAWSPDQESAYYVDSATGRVDVFHDDATSLVERRTLVQLDPDDGTPDGICVDAEGGIWVALWEGGAVRRFDASGILTEVVTIPVPLVTACTFGGSDMDDLFVTTSRYEKPAGEAPGSGAVFHVTPGVSGLPTAAYAG